MVFLFKFDFLSSFGFFSNKDSNKELRKHVKISDKINIKNVKKNSIPKEKDKTIVKINANIMPSSPKNKKQPAKINIIMNK